MPDASSSSIHLDTHATIEELLEVSSFMWTILRLYSKGHLGRLANDSEGLVSDSE